MTKAKATQLYSELEPAFVRAAVVWSRSKQRDYLHEPEDFIQQCWVATMELPDEINTVEWIVAAAIRKAKDSLKPKRQGSGEEVQGYYYETPSDAYGDAASSDVEGGYAKYRWDLLMNECEERGVELSDVEYDVLEARARFHSVSTRVGMVADWLGTGKQTVVNYTKSAMSKLEDAGLIEIESGESGIGKLVRWLYPAGFQLKQEVVNSELDKVGPMGTSPRQGMFMDHRFPYNSEAEMDLLNKKSGIAKRRRPDLGLNVFEKFPYDFRGKDD